ncbi:MAG: YceI family protein [Pseudomonadota bacterium]
MRMILAAAASLIALPALAESVDIPSGTYTVDNTHASVVWKVSHLGFSNYTGKFDRSGIDATVNLDADNVANSTLNVTLDGQAVNTGHPGDKDFNAEVEGPKFLNTVEFPSITFTTTSIDVTGANTAVINGDLSLSGQTHPFSLDATLNRAADNPMSGKPMLGVSATGTLDRTTWGVNGLAGPIGTEVAIEVEAEFILSE